MGGFGEIALGSVQWGMPYGIANQSGPPTGDELPRLLKLAQDAGVRTIDTARAYGASESEIGRHIGDDPRWRVVTKTDPAVVDAAGLLESLRASEAALKRSPLDAVLLHRPVQKAGVWAQLLRERDAGRVGMVGLSALTPAHAWAALDDPDVDIIQVAASLFDQRLARAGFFEAARGRVVFVRSIYLQGVAHLAPDALPAHLSELRGPLAAVRETGVPAWQLFLAYAGTLPGAVPLLGCERAAQLAENVAAWQDRGRHRETVERLAAEMPALPDRVVEPAIWKA